MAQFADTATAHGIMEAMLDLVVDGIDTGTTDVNGDLLITDTAQGAGNIIVTIPFGAVAYAASAWDAANNWADANLTDGTAIYADASASYTAAGFLIRNQDNNNIITGTAGAGSEDIVLDNAVITSGQTVTITSLEFRLPEA